MEFRVLRRLFPADPNRLSGEYYAGRSKLKVHLGEDIFERLRGKTVVDFGCGQGHQTIEIAQQGAALSIGVDVREELLVAAGEKAAGVPNATFLNSTRLGTTQFADFVLSIDAFEHFADPEGALRQMYGLLKPGGLLLVSFGPPWLHPLGGHAFSVFPWSHKLLSEQALCRWHNAVQQTHLLRFEEADGGLNRMTIARFQALARLSPFRRVSITLVPIRKLRRFHHRITRELTTAAIHGEFEK